MNDIEKEHIKAIKENLPPKWVSIIAQEHNVTEGHARTILNRYMIDNPLFDNILQLAERNRQERQEIEDRIKDLANGGKEGPKPKRRQVDPTKAIGLKRNIIASKN